jgi:hypothetical protein
VAVIGAGASAVEAGALVHEAGGKPRILVREREVTFHSRLDVNRPWIERLRNPISVLGPGRKNRLLEELPFALYFVPRARRMRLAKGYPGPAAPWWITDRVRDIVPIELRTSVTGATPRGDGVRLTLSRHGETRTLDVDHVIAGTGFVSDVDRLAYLDPALRTRIRRVEQAPALSIHFESSVKGLYFLGPIAALCFGPLFRFVCGAKYAAPAVARHLAGGFRLSVTSPLGRASRPEPRERVVPDPRT